MKVLIVDDNKYFRDIIKDILKSYNYELYEADNGLIAYEKYKSIKPNIVTMDVDMPLMNGFEAVQKIMEYDKNANILMCSTLMAMNFYKKKAIDLGAKKVVAKPYTKEEFEDAFSEIIEMME